MTYFLVLVIERAAGGENKFVQGSSMSLALPPTKVLTGKVAWVVRQVRVGPSFSRCGTLKAKARLSTPDLLRGFLTCSASSASSGPYSEYQFTCAHHSPLFYASENGIHCLIT